MHHKEIYPGIHANFNSDFSGDVIIDCVGWPDGVTLPFEALETLVAHKYGKDLISKIKDANAQDILTGRWLR